MKSQYQYFLQFQKEKYFIVTESRRNVRKKNYFNFTETAEKQKAKGMFSVKRRKNGINLQITLINK